MVPSFLVIHPIDSPCSSFPIDPAILENIPTIVLTEAEKSICPATQKAPNNVEHQYSIQFVIETFVAGMVVTVRVFEEDLCIFDYTRLYVRVINQGHCGRYKLQTKYGILDRLLPTRELKRVDDPTLAGMISISNYIHAHIL